MQGSEGVTAPFVRLSFSLQISIKQTQKSTLIFNSFIAILGYIFPPSNHKDKRTKNRGTHLLCVWSHQKTHHFRSKGYQSPLPTYPML